MRNRIVSVLTLFLLCKFVIDAQEFISFDAKVSEYGQLRTILGESWDKVDSLSVTGPINATDFRTMWECAFYGNLSVLNLEKAQVENNTIPDYALCDINKQYWDVNPTIYLGIRKIILPNNIVEIGVSAFNYMKLEEINLPASLRKLNIYSFGNCHWLNVDPLIIPEGVVEIPTQCFVNCQNFKELILPTTLRTISPLAFYNTRMEKIQFPNNLDSIGFAAFEGSALLRKAMIPDNCQRLGDFIFNHCDSLREIHIPNGIERIPNSFVALGNFLETVNIPESVTEIGDFAFQWCYALKDIKLPEGLRTIGYDAFHYCNPDSIVFPISLEFIDGGSCKHWNNLKKIYSKSPIPPYCNQDRYNLETYCFEGTPSYIPVYVPIGSADLYRNAQGWSYFSNFIETDNFPSAGIYGITMEKSHQSKVYWSNGNLNIEILNEIELPVSYSVYTIDGKMIQCGKISSSNFSIQIPKDFYIVKIGKQIFKVY